MKTHVDDLSVRNEPVWASLKMPSGTSLRSDLQVDVCVVGGGISGLTTAYLLQREGKSVAVLDDGPLASGMTTVTTAHLASAIDDRFTHLESIHGEEVSRLAAASHAAAIDRIEQIIREEKIRCDFQRLDGYLFLAPNDDPDMLDRELEAAHRAGLTHVEKITRAPLASFDSGPCLQFPNQGQFHPLKYLAGIARAIKRDGGRLLTKTHADRITGGSPARVQSGDYAITADAVFVATNTPVNDRFAIHTKQAPYMTYVIGAKVPRRSIAPGLYWDTQDPYHYVRLQTMHRSKAAPVAYDLLIVGGEDHKSGQADDTDLRHARLEAWSRERFPMMEEIVFTWGGQVMETIDGLAFIGRNPGDEENVFIATGDSGMGMTHGTIAGILITDLILGRENPWERVYDPARRPVSAAGEFAKENLNVALQYTDWITGSEVSSVDHIGPGCGAVMRQGLSKVAVYRDEEGQLHACSAVCPHLGCIVHFNHAEKTWDCPCHGSRFGPEGNVINGPANSDLPEAEIPETRSTPVK